MHHSQHINRIRSLPRTYQGAIDDAYTDYQFVECMKKLGFEHASLRKIQRQAEETIEED